MRTAASLFLLLLTAGLAACNYQNFLPPKPDFLSPKRQDVVAVTERGRHPVALEWLRKSADSLENEDWAGAVTSASAAASVDPLCDNAFVVRGIAYYKQNLPDPAIADCDRAIAVNPENLLAYNCRGLVYAQKGQMEQSQQELDRAIKKYGGPGGSGSVVRKSNVDDDKRLFRAACHAGLVAACEGYRGLTGSYPPAREVKRKPLVEEKREGARQTDWTAVIVTASQAIRQDSGNATAYAARAEGYAQTGKVKEAYEDADKAVQLAPDFGPAYSARGFALELMGKMDEARLDYGTACAKGVQPACASLARLKATGQLEKAGEQDKQKEHGAGK
jgi:tetratricopeptide (TPR) repeat protein